MNSVTTPKPRLIGLTVGLALTVLAMVAAGNLVAGDKLAWTQWGGPNQDFKSDATGLSQKWPETGPPELWKRDLGEGYSAILVDDGKLYTMCRKDDQEVVISMNAADGETVWEYAYDSSPSEGHISQFGDGPRATPLIDGKRIFTVGVSGVMNALDKKTGKLAWSQDLWKDHGGSFLNHGYSSSPIAYKDTIIVPVGGEGHALMAFNKKDGSVAWQNQDFDNSYSTARIFSVDGDEQLIIFMAKEIIGVDPNNGDLKWSHPHENQWGQNINMPVMADANHIFFSSPTAGAKGLKLTSSGGKTNVEEMWSTRKIQFYHVTSVREGNYVYGSTGMRAPAFMAAVNVKTGEIAWRKRDFGKANVISADGKLFILDEDGNLAIATATPEDLVVHSKVELLDKVAWTVPTIVGKTMYVRDKTSIRALDLG
jgi:outer membrane protein assembly factor BamB